MLQGFGGRRTHQAQSTGRSPDGGRQYVPAPEPRRFRHRRQSSRDRSTAADVGDRIRHHDRHRGNRRNGILVCARGAPVRLWPARRPDRQAADRGVRRDHLGDHLPSNDLRGFTWIARGPPAAMRFCHRRDRAAYDGLRRRLDHLRRTARRARPLHGHGDDRADRWPGARRSCC